MPKKAAAVEMHCSKCRPGSEIAKNLGVYLGQLYGWVKAGKLENHKPDGKYVTDDGSGLWADPEEAKAVWMSSKKKTRDPNKPRASKAKARNDDGEIIEKPKATRLKDGTIISYENGKRSNSHSMAKPTYTVAQAVGSTGHLTFLDDGGQRRHYDGTLVGDIVFSTERLSTMLAKGVARIEHPSGVLGMVILAYIYEGRTDLAESLEKWMIKHDIPVVIPEIMDLEEEPEEDPIRSMPILTMEVETADA